MSDNRRERRVFRKFTFRGIDLEQLVDYTVSKRYDDLMPLLCARQRRRFGRGLTRKHTALLKKLKKARANCDESGRPETVRTHLRDMIIVPEMIGSVIGVYNGKSFVLVEVKGSMIGHYLAEFAISYKPVAHGRPGIGASGSSKFVPLK